jgi:putative addiction module component (TIGR02574 family)
MGRALRKITNDALALPEEDRLALAAELIDSVEGPDDAEWSAAWSAEIDRRVAEADRTGDRGRPWDVIRSELLERLARR